MTRARGEMELEMNLRKMQHKEDKMQRKLPVAARLQHYHLVLGWGIA